MRFSRRKIRVGNIIQNPRRLSEVHFVNLFHDLDRSHKRESHRQSTSRQTVKQNGTGNELSQIDEYLYYARASSGSAFFEQTP